MSLVDALQYLAPLIGIGALVIGILAVVRPEPMSKKFGITVTGSALPYVMSTGIRDVFIGLVILILFYVKNWFLIGAIHLFVGIVAVSDFLVVQKYGDKKTSIVHFLGAVLVFAYGAWLLYH